MKWNYLLTILLLSISTTVFSQSTPPQPEACTRYRANPVLSGGRTGSWDQDGLWTHSVVPKAGGYLMWYSNLGNNGSIGLAASDDGVSWIKYAYPVLQPGQNGTWDSLAVYVSSVIWNGTRYLMYYTGVGFRSSPASIGLAISNDTIHWQKYVGNPVITPGPGKYDNVSVKLPTVIYDPPLYKMWYVGRQLPRYNYSIHFATSPDGIHWTKFAGNPVLTVGRTGILSVLGPTEPSVVKLGPTYFMAFEINAFTGYATSDDGINWNSTRIPLLTSSNDTSSPEYIVDYPSLMAKNSTLLLWYTRWPSSINPPPNIGVAFCNLVRIPEVRTTAATQTQTQTSRVTETTSTTRTEVAFVPETPYYQYTSIALALVLAVTLYSLVTLRRHHARVSD